MNVSDWNMWVDIQSGNPLSDPILQCNVNKWHPSFVSRHYGHLADFESIASNYQQWIDGWCVCRHRITRGSKLAPSCKPSAEEKKLMRDWICSQGREEENPTSVSPRKRRQRVPQEGGICSIKQWRQFKQEKLKVKVAHEAKNMLC